MLHSIKDLEGTAISASDGDIGNVKDFYFDDEAWAIRYLIVETGSWLSNRKVLISPLMINRSGWEGNVLATSITKERVQNSPNIDTDRPVSRQHESQYLGYYGYPFYWSGLGMWGDYAYPGMLIGVPSYLRDNAQDQDSHQTYTRIKTTSADHHDNHHLRSCNEVMKYTIHASDGDIGRVDGMLLDEETWAIRYLIVNTSNWWHGHQVLIAPYWIENVSWGHSSVSVDLTRQAVKDAPHYDPFAPMDREQEIGLYKHYGRNGYWLNKQDLEQAIA